MQDEKDLLIECKKSKKKLYDELYLTSKFSDINMDFEGIKNDFEAFSKQYLIVDRYDCVMKASNAKKTTPAIEDNYYMKLYRDNVDNAFKAIWRFNNKSSRHGEQASISQIMDKLKKSLTGQASLVVDRDNQIFIQHASQGFSKG